MLPNIARETETRHKSLFRTRRAFTFRCAVWVSLIAENTVLCTAIVDITVLTLGLLLFLLLWRYQLLSSLWYRRWNILYFPIWCVATTLHISDSSSPLSPHALLCADHCLYVRFGVCAKLTSCWVPARVTKMKFAWIFFRNCYFLVVVNATAATENNYLHPIQVRHSTMMAISKICSDHIIPSEDQPYFISERFISFALLLHHCSGQ